MHPLVHMKSQLLQALQSSQRFYALFLQNLHPHAFVAQDQLQSEALALAYLPP